MGYHHYTRREEIDWMQVDILHQIQCDGSINWFRARLLAKDFTQLYGVDYEETFPPVAKINSI